MKHTTCPTHHLCHSPLSRGRSPPPHAACARAHTRPTATPPHSYKHPLLKDVYARVGTLRKAWPSPHVALTRIHHPGHQKDSSWFTLLNRTADNLASMRQDVDVRVPESQLAVLAGKSLEDARAVVVQAQAAAATAAKA